MSSQTRAPCNTQMRWYKEIWCLHGYKHVMKKHKFILYSDKHYLISHRNKENRRWLHCRLALWCIWRFLAVLFDWSFTIVIMPDKNCIFTNRNMVIAACKHYIYIYIYQMDCVCQRYHKECLTRTCADDCYNCWKSPNSSHMYDHGFMDNTNRQAVCKSQKNPLSDSQTAEELHWKP